MTLKTKDHKVELKYLIEMVLMIMTKTNVLGALVSEVVVEEKLLMIIIQLIQTVTAAVATEKREERLSVTNLLKRKQ